MEPCRRDTFPAIALASSYLHDVMGVSGDEPVVICPVDPYVEDGYFKTIEELGRQAAKGESNLVLMGIKPTYPSEKYGYIIPTDESRISKVSSLRKSRMEKWHRSTLPRGFFGTGAYLPVD